MKISVIPISLDGEIKKGDDLISKILDSKSYAGLLDGDILVFTQKIISKQEGQIIKLSKIKPSLLAIGIASAYAKDPRIIQIILDESKRIIRMKNGIIISETRLGFVCANAGVDESNIESGYASVLPKNPQRSAAKLKREIKKKTGKDVAVIISDTFGRPFREGQIDVAIGYSGILPILDYAGTRDSFGKKLHVTAIAIVDEICAASELVRGKSDQTPIAIVRNYKFKNKERKLSDLLRIKANDLFR